MQECPECLNVQKHREGCKYGILEDALTESNRLALEFENKFNDSNQKCSNLESVLAIQNQLMDMQKRLAASLMKERDEARRERMIISIQLEQWRKE